jgi:outer membrane receptor protein involved in Fe transport
MLPLSAQDGTDDSEPDEEMAFELSPFEVSTSSDVGYLSTNSTSGTSLNTAIKDLPMSIQVVNREFISDYGASNLEEALVYAAGVFTSDNQASSATGGTRSGGRGDRSISSAGSGSRFANVVYIRGLSTPYQNRMGFRYGGLVVTPNSAVALGGMLDSVNMERMEVVKGPNSLLYGVGVLTGIVNVIPRRPLDEPRYTVSVKAGNYDYFRTEADLTGPIFNNDLLGSLNYRLAGSYEESGNWTDFREDQTEYWVAQLEYRPADWAKIFLEYQDGYTRMDGIGSQWIYDDIRGAKDTEFRNQYDEAYNWARHEGELPTLRSLDPNGFDSTVNYSDQNGNSGSQPGFRQTDSTFTGGGLPDSYRITGPDTFAERDEQNFLADLELYPLEGLTINVGGLWTKQETFERNLQFNGATATDANNFFQNRIPRDTQLNAIWESGGIYGASMQDVVADLFGVNFDVNQTSHPGDWVLPVTSDDIKLTEYWWRDSVVKSESAQYRLRVTYTFDTDFPGGGAKHTLLGGVTYIEDKIDFPDGNIDRGNAEANKAVIYDHSSPIDANTQGTSISGDRPYDRDGLYFRSIANFSPLYMDGRNDGVSGHSTVRDGDVYLHQTIEQTGLFGVYNGSFFKDRVKLTLGVRQDIYNAHQYTHNRVNIDESYLRALALDSAEFEARNQADILVGRADMALNDQVYESLLAQTLSTDVYIANYYREDIESGNEGYFGIANRGGAPDASYGVVPGSEFDIFEEDVKVTTYTVGLNVDLTPDIALYGIMSEGVSPNTALRDGNGDIIPAEETLNKEIGIKFDLFDNKLSGSIALFQIDRENAIWDVPYAPAASKWVDAQLSPNRSSEWTVPTYDPESPSTYFVQSRYFIDYLSQEFGIDPDYLNFAQQGTQIQQQVGLADLDPSLPISERLRIVRDIQQSTLFPGSFASQWNSQAAFGGNVPINIVGLNADGLDELQPITLYDPATNEFVTREISNLPVLYAAFMDRELDKTKNSLLSQNHPVRYRRFTTSGMPQDNNNTDFDQSSGSLVTFDERINGVEVELIYSPLENLQFVFGYSHIEREARDSFDFTDWRSIAGTEGTYIPPFTMLHREYGWESSGYELAWVDFDAFDAARTAAGDGTVSINDIPEGQVERISGESVDETISTSEFNQRSDQGQILVFVDQRDNILREGNSVTATDFSGLLSGVSLNFNPEDEASLWGKYTFTEDHGWLDGFSVSAGVKYSGPSATSVAFNSISPLNELTVTPEVPERYRVDLGLFYKWRWDDVDMRLSLNVYNVFDDTYDVNIVTLNTLNPITGEEVTKRTEKFYAPTSFRLGLSASF